MKRQLRKVIPIRKNPRGWRAVKMPVDYSYPKTFSPLLMDLIVENITDSNKEKFSDLLSLWYEGEIGHDYNVNLEKNGYSKTTWEFAKIILNRSQKSDLRYRLEYSKLSNDLSKEILRNKYPKPEYPTYKKVAKELFEE